MKFSLHFGKEKNRGTCDTLFAKSCRNKDVVEDHICAWLFPDVYVLLCPVCIKRKYLKYELL